MFLEAMSPVETWWADRTGDRKTRPWEGEDADRKAREWQDRMLGPMAESTAVPLAANVDGSAATLIDQQDQTSSSSGLCLNSSSSTDQLAPPLGTQETGGVGCREPEAHATHEVVEEDQQKKKKLPKSLRAKGGGVRTWVHRWGKRVYLGADGKPIASKNKGRRRDREKAERDRTAAEAAELKAVERAGRQAEVRRARLAAEAAKLQIIGVRQTIELQAPEEGKSYSRNVEAETLPLDERLSVEDLVAWKRSWELSASDVARILLIKPGACLKLLTLALHRKLSVQISKRLRAFRVLSRASVLASVIAKETELPGAHQIYTVPYGKEHDHLLWNVRVIKSNRYKNEAYTHGLWPGELQYYRYVAQKVLRPTKGQRACCVVHVPTKLTAECSDYLDFVVNRAVAEARLSVKLARYMRLCQRKGRKMTDRRVKIRLANKEERYGAKRSADRKKSRRKKRKQQQSEQPKTASAVGSRKANGATVVRSDSDDGA